MTRSLTWIHISDLHAGRPSSWDWHDVRRALIEDIQATIIEHKLEVDFLFFTGDAAFGNSPDAHPPQLRDQFGEAADFLETIRRACTPVVDPERVFIVPGNHDIDNTQIGTAIQSYLASLSLADLDAFVTSHKGANWHQAVARLAEYRHFLAAGPYTHLAPANDLCVHSVRVRRNDVNVAIACWDSAWTCSGNKGDQGRLWLGYKGHIALSHNIVEQADVRLLLMHHPPSWFREEESGQVQKAIEQRFDFFLHGHEHDPWLRQKDDGHATLSASATYDAGTNGNGYNIVRLDVEAGVGEVWFRQYDRQNASGRFIPIVNIQGADNNGRATLRIKSRQKPVSGANMTAPEAAEMPKDFTTLTRLGAGEPPIVGRKIEVNEFSSKLVGSAVLLVVGPPGQGKSVLSRAVAKSLDRDFPDGAWVINVQNEKRLEPVVRQIAAICQSPATGRLRDILDGKRAIFVLDGFESLYAAIEDKDVIRDFFEELILGAASGSRIIVTSQVAFEKTGVAVTKLAGLDADAAIELFRDAAKYNLDASDDEIREFVVDRLEGHPLSINIVGSYCASLVLDFEQLKVAYGEAWSEIAQHRPTLDDRTLSASFGLSYRALAEEQKAVFLACGLLPDGIERSMVSRIWPAESSTNVLTTFAGLRDRSLLQFDGRAFRAMQPLLHYAEREYHAAISIPGDGVGDRARALATAIDAFCDTFVEQWAPRSGDADNSLKSRQIRDNFLNIHRSIDRRLSAAGTPESLAAAQSVLRLYWAYHNNLTGRNSTIPIEASVGYLQQAERVFESHDERLAALECRFYVGQLLWLRGDRAVARTYLEEVLAAPELSITKRLDCKRAFAHMEYATGSIAHAASLYDNIVDEANAAQEPQAAIKARIGLIDCYRKLEDYVALERVLEALRPVLAAQPDDVRGNVLRGIAFARLASGDIETAESVYNEALIILREVSPFGEAHCMRGLGEVYTAQGKWPKAEEAFATALRLYREAGKPRSLGVGLVTVGLGSLRARQGQFEEGAAYYREAIQLFGVSQLNERFDQARAYELLGDLHIEAKRPAEAAGAYRLAIGGFRHSGCQTAELRVTRKLDLQTQGHIVDSPDSRQPTTPSDNAQSERPKSAPNSPTLPESPDASTTRV